MKIMFIGLGLIGGSMALALEGYPNLERYAVDGDEPTRLEALGRGVVRAAWSRSDDAPIEDMDIVVLCLHPGSGGGFYPQTGGQNQARCSADRCMRREASASGSCRGNRRQKVYLSRRSSHGGTGAPAALPTRRATSSAVRITS